MKHLLLIIASLLFTFCSSKDEKPENSLLPDNKQTEEPQPENPNTETNNDKILIVFYSYTGNCKDIATLLSSLLNPDIVEVTPAEKGLKYEADNYALGTQLLNKIKSAPDDVNSYPSIDPLTADLSLYGNVIVVTPLWWSQMSAIMQSYLFRNADAFKDKKTALIVSSHSSGISGVETDAKRLLPQTSWLGKSLWINNSNRNQLSSLLENWITESNLKKSSNTMKINITIGDKTMSATLENNSSSKALYDALQQSAIIYEAHDYGDFEKVGDLGQTFPKNDKNITTQPGDIILYQGNNLCLYYGENTWNFTKIGTIDNATQQSVKDFVKAGNGNVTIKLSVE